MSELEPTASVEEVQPEAEASEEVAAEGTSEQPRDEQGRFAPAEAEQEQPLILGRFKSQEELEKAYSQLDSEFGRRNQEWGELRKEIEQIRTQTSQPHVPLNQETVDWFDEQVEQNPYGAAEWARQNDPSGALYNRALESWYDMPGGARQASAYERQLEMGQMAQWVQAQQQPVMETVQQQKITDAFLAVRSQHPDIDQYAEQILAEAQANPEFLTPLQSGSSEDGQRVIRNLLRLAKAEQANTAVSRTGQVLAQQASQAEAAREQAFVATGGSVQEPSVKTPEDEWLENVFDKAAARYYGPES